MLYLRSRKGCGSLIRNSSVPLAFPHIPTRLVTEMASDKEGCRDHHMQLSFEDIFLFTRSKRIKSSAALSFYDTIAQK